jgi:hypothetical protein
MIIKVFEAGEYPQGSWPVERVRALVSSYDPVNATEAPAVVGHMENVLVERLENELAYGWVRSLSMDEGGTVWADMPNEDISPELRSWILNKNLRYVSVEIAEFDLKEPGKAPYLVRVAFLGRSIPAVSTARVPSLFRKLLGVVGFGRKDEQPEEGVPVARFCRRLNAEAVADLAASAPRIQAGNGLADPDDAPRPEPAEAIVSEPSAGEGPATFTSVTEGSMGEKELQEEVARLKADNAALGEKLGVFESAAAASKAAEVRKAAESYFGALRDAGAITPAKFDQAVAIDVTLDEKARKDFRSLFGKEEGQKPAGTLGRGHFASGDRAAGEKPLEGSLVKEIQAFARKENIGFEEAARRLHAERPALFAQEA